MWIFNLFKSKDNLRVQDNYVYLTWPLKIKITKKCFVFYDLQWNYLNRYFPNNFVSYEIINRKLVDIINFDIALNKKIKINSVTQIDLQNIIDRIKTEIWLKEDLIKNSSEDFEIDWPIEDLFKENLNSNWLKIILEKKIKKLVDSSIFIVNDYENKNFKYENLITIKNYKLYWNSDYHSYHWFMALYCWQKIEQEIFDKNKKATKNKNNEYVCHIFWDFRSINLIRKFKINNNSYFQANVNFYVTFDKNSKNLLHFLKTPLYYDSDEKEINDKSYAKYIIESVWLSNISIDTNTIFLYIYWKKENTIAPYLSEIKKSLENKILSHINSRQEYLEFKIINEQILEQEVKDRELYQSILRMSNLKPLDNDIRETLDKSKKIMDLYDQIDKLKKE